MVSKKKSYLLFFIISMTKIGNSKWNILSNFSLYFSKTMDTKSQNRKFVSLIRFYRVNNGITSLKIPN